MRGTEPFWEGERAVRRRLRVLTERWGVGLAAAGLAVALLPVLRALGVTVVDFHDVEIYRSYGQSMVVGGVPYRDVPIEYPPGALPVFLVPALLTSSYLAYAIVFAAIVGGLGMVGLVLAARIGTMIAPRSRAWAARTLGTACMVGLLGAVALTRFDFIPATLTVAALYALLRNRFSWAGVCLGSAVAVKLYPAVIFPIAAVYVLRRGGTHAVARFIAIVTVVAAACYVPFVLLAPDGVYESLRVQAGRSLQIESSGASLLWLAKEVGLVSWPEQPTYYDLTSHVAAVMGTATTLAGVALLALLLRTFTLGPADGPRLVRYSFASVATFVVFGKVLSPQYLLWLALFVPALRGSRANAVAALLGAAALATAIYFPRWFPSVVTELPPYVLGLIAMRNLFLGGLLAVLVWGVERGDVAFLTSVTRLRQQEFNPPD